MSTETAVTPLRQRMIEDMAARNLNRHTQRSHIGSCKRFAQWLGRCPDTIAKTYFPKAMIVADRFHVVRLALHHLMATCRQIDPGLATGRGPAKLLQKHARNLTERQAGRLEDYLAGQPAVARIYAFKEELMTVLTAKRQTKDRCRMLVHRLLDAIRQLAASPFEDCRKLAKTLESWQVEIGRMWRFSRSNGITEGFHRKMKLIQRRAFGFRNFENYRRRVRALCA